MQPRAKVKLNGDSEEVSVDSVVLEDSDSLASGWDSQDSDSLASDGDSQDSDSLDSGGDSQALVGDSQALDGDSLASAAVVSDGEDAVLDAVASVGVGLDVEASDMADAVLQSLVGVMLQSLAIAVHSILR